MKGLKLVSTEEGELTARWQSWKQPSEFWARHVEASFSSDTGAYKRRGGPSAHVVADRAPAGVGGYPQAQLAEGTRSSTGRAGRVQPMSTQTRAARRARDWRNRRATKIESRLSGCDQQAGAS